jgi:hypothetical protein
MEGKLLEMQMRSYVIKTFKLAKQHEIESILFKVPFNNNCSAFGVLKQLKNWNRSPMRRSTT